MPARDVPASSSCQSRGRSDRPRLAETGGYAGMCRCIPTMIRSGLLPTSVRLARYSARQPPATWCFFAMPDSVSPETDDVDRPGGALRVGAVARAGAAGRRAEVELLVDVFAGAHDSLCVVAGRRSGCRPATRPSPGEASTRSAMAICSALVARSAREA